MRFTGSEKISGQLCHVKLFSWQKVEYSWRTGKYWNTGWPCIPTPLWTLPHLKSDTGNTSLGKVSHVKWFSAREFEYLRRTWTCCKPGWAWKLGWNCTWPWPCPKRNCKQKFKSGTMPIQHIKGQPAVSCVREKDCFKCNTYMLTQWHSTIMC